MLKLLLALTTALAATGALLWLVSGPPDPSTLPKLDLGQWWGPMELKGKTDESIRPFKIEFSEQMIKDLKHRLDNSRAPPPPLDGAAFNYGFNSALLDTWRSYWRDEYDFKAREQFLNTYPQYKTNIQGLDIHFIRVQPTVPAGVEVLPLLMMHGWPGSVAEFYEAIPLLTRHVPGQNFVFEVVVPSLPGYGFSDAAVRPGLGSSQMAVVMRNLMHRLGHKQFYLQGGDWGALIGSNLVTLFPHEVLGFHCNMAIATNTRSNLLLLLGAIFPSLVVPPHQAHRLYPLSQFFENMMLETGYFHIQATKPDTVGVGLTDSPLGLLAYILEKFSTGSRQVFRDREDGGLLEFFSKDQLLDNLMIYWANGAMTTAMRLYAETASKAHVALDVDSISSVKVDVGTDLTLVSINNYQTPVPTWALQASNDFYAPPAMLRTKFVNLLDVTELDGGHFIAMEQPGNFANDVFKAVNAFRRWRSDEGRSEL